MQTRVAHTKKRNMNLVYLVNNPLLLFSFSFLQKKKLE